MKRLLVVSLLALAAPALADVTVERFFRSGGLAGLGANETTTVEKLSGLHKREASTTKLKGALGGFLGRLASDIRNESITNVEKDTVWTLDHGARRTPSRRSRPHASRQRTKTPSSRNRGGTRRVRTSRWCETR